MTGGGASTLHHMCVDRCELADDRMHVKQCILYPSHDLTFCLSRERVLCQVAFTAFQMLECAIVFSLLALGSHTPFLSVIMYFHHQMDVI